MTFASPSYFLLLLLAIPYVLWYFLFRRRHEGTLTLASTEVFRKALAHIDRKLAAVCDVVIEAAAGNFILHKGDLPL